MVIGIDGRSISDIKTQDLGLEQKPYVEVRFGIKPDALNVGGINLFGEKFGNYPQPIVLKVNFAHPNGGTRIEQARLNGSQPNTLS
ncbi:hypothetical protein [Ktedonobacter racemifer]|uniref:hypothetical protein n=1 Tax=Ktedonobacter racemifer TaxID=363277 RepID=UPI0005914C45|nr:hypothetical protein [Ktedonobacter racemifer]